MRRSRPRPCCAERRRSKTRRTARRRGERNGENNDARSNSDPGDRGGRRDHDHRARRRRRSPQAHRRPARQLGHVDCVSRREGRHLQEARHRPRDHLHVGLGRDAAAGHRRLVDLGFAVGTQGAMARLCQGRAGAHHRRGGDRRRRLLVRQGVLADQNAAGHQRPHHCVFDQRLVDPEHRPRLHRRVQAHRQADGDRQPVGDAHRCHDRSGRRRLGLAPVRAQGTGGRARSAWSPRPPTPRWCAARPSG